MIPVLLTILKVIGVALLVLLGLIIFVALLVLFVPVRYSLDAKKAEEGERPFTCLVRATWLLHLLNIRFQYPDAAYLRVRILLFNVFCFGKEKDPEEKEGSTGSSDKKHDRMADESSPPPAKEETTPKKETDSNSDGALPEKDISVKEDDPTEEKEAKKAPTLRGFIRKLLSILKNIRYTITQICDKIKHIVNNIQYYLSILKSDAFGQAFGVCKHQIWELLRSIRPRKIKGSVLIGTGDPAGTGQIFAVYGILYPFLGSRIVVTPDFERKVIAGEIRVKGKATVFHLVKAAWIIYFNKDLRHILKMFKREAA